MRKKPGQLLFTAWVAAAVLALSHFAPTSQSRAAQNDHAKQTEQSVVKGPHRGRMLSDGDFALEITIFETGVPPEFHVYPYWRGTPVAPAEVKLRIELGRLSGIVDRFEFTAKDEYLRGHGVVTEPHSFDVSVAAEYQGKTYRWGYENYEGRTTIAEEIAVEAGIVTAKAGAGTIEEVLALNGRVHIDPDRLSRVRARFAGMVQSVNVSLGDTVRKGQVLATVQSNESLQSYELRAPIGGLIFKRDIQVGESTGDHALFMIADLSRVWVELDVFGRDLPKLRPGQTVRVETLDGYAVKGEVEWLSPFAAHGSQSVRARVPVANAEGRLRPGQFVRAAVVIASHSVDIAVRRSAIQAFRDFQVVFAKYGETYEVRMLELGRRNRDWVEVKSGLAPGTEYVSENSFVIKADVEKSGASHDH